MLVDFGDDVNFLKGKNASGKTNMLEAIYLLGIGKSPRTPRDKELIRFDCERAYIKAVIEKKYRSHTIEFVLEKNAKKISIDGLPISRLSELVGVFNVVFFSPDELKFIKDSPADRRQFLDISLCQQSKMYFLSLAKYNKILAQRNKLLKTDYKNPSIADMLSIWDTQFAEYGANLILARRAYVKKLCPFAEQTHAELTSNKESLSLQYECCVDASSRAEIVAELISKLRENMDKDLSLFHTSFGPHRDDIKICINDLDARKFASQGQQRSAALSVKIAELSLFEKETGESPVLLLDDVLSELDENRKMKLLNLSCRTQTLITCTNFDFKLPIAPKQFVIENGKIIK